jgi:hypothetical protein
LRFLEKMRGAGTQEQEKQLTRLENMSGEAMKEELKMWILRRKRILKKLLAAPAKEEL